MRVLIVGVSTRAFAVSAAQAGYRVGAIDAFGDLDQAARLPVTALRRESGSGWSARAAARASRGVRCDAVVYVSSLENHPAAVRLLARGRRLLGNPPAVLERVRDPILVTRAFARAGFRVPAVRLRSPRTDDGTRWLLKPRASGGGHGIQPWRPGEGVAASHYLQERVRGVPGSIVFVADGRRAVPLLITRQIVGEAAFGARRFKYCGNIAAGATPQFAAEDLLVERASLLAAFITREFGLIGVNGIDFIARNGVPWPIEINPRYSASMELAERSYGVSVFAAHAAGCAGKLTPFDLPAARGHARAAGKAVVYARCRVRLGDTRSWLRAGWIADVPRPGGTIDRGAPICTVFAEARSAERCHEALVRRARRIYRKVESAGRRTA